MTPYTPPAAAGDIWEWMGVDPCYILLLRCTVSPIDIWTGLNLTAGVIEDISMHDHNRPNWRKAA